MFAFVDEIACSILTTPDDFYLGSNGWFVVLKGTFADSGLCSRLCPRFRPGIIIRTAPSRGRQVKQVHSGK